jgi:hypothetical protein
MLTWRHGLGATVDDLAQSIARMEGFLVPGSIAQVNNNPGNLRSGPGQIGTSNGFAVFPDVATGYAALDSQIDYNVSLGLNLDQFFAGEPGVYPGYAPSADSNNPTQYASTVAGMLNIDPTVPLSGVLGSSTGSASSDSAITAPTSDDSSVFDALDLSSLSAISGTTWAAIALILAAVVLAVRR